MKRVILFAAISILFLSAQACQLANASRESLINPPADSGTVIWLGADSAASVQVSPDHYVWLFADTLLGTTHHQIRHLTQIVHNSIGVLECHAGNCHKMQKYVGWHKGSATAIFNLANQQQYLWPTAGVMQGQHLLITAYRMQAEPRRILGSVIIEVSNPRVNPRYWDYQIYNLTMTSNKLTLASGIAIQQHWLYLLGEEGSGINARTIMARIRLTAVTAHLWNQISPLLLKTHLPPISETVLWQNAPESWLIYAIPPFSRRLHMYQTESLLLPWHDQGVVHQFTDRQVIGEQVNYYAAKIHPEFNTANDNVLTYNTNFVELGTVPLSTLSAAINDPQYTWFYVPQFLSLKK